jgi:hypothetical protein
MEDVSPSPDAAMRERRRRRRAQGGVAWVGSEEGVEEVGGRPWRRRRGAAWPAVTPVPRRRPWGRAVERRRLAAVEEGSPRCRLASRARCREPVTYPLFFTVVWSRPRYPLEPMFLVWVGPFTHLCQIRGAGQRVPWVHRTPGSRPPLEGRRGEGARCSGDGRNPEGEDAVWRERCGEGGGA